MFITHEGEFSSRYVPAGRMSFVLVISLDDNKGAYTLPVLMDISEGFIVDED